MIGESEICSQQRPICSLAVLQNSWLPLYPTSFYWCVHCPPSELVFSSVPPSLSHTATISAPSSVSCNFSFNLAESLFTTLHPFQPACTHFFTSFQHSLLTLRTSCLSLSLNLCTLLPQCNHLYTLLRVTFIPLPPAVAKRSRCRLQTWYSGSCLTSSVSLSIIKLWADPWCGPTSTLFSPLSQQDTPALSSTRHCAAYHYFSTTCQRGR